MKKVSTTVAKQTNNFSAQKLTIGLDLGDRWSWYCMLDEAGSVRLAQRLSTTPKAMREVLGGMARSRIALETGMHSPWVSGVLSEFQHEVIVAHARNVRLIGEGRKKDERWMRGCCGDSAGRTNLVQRKNREPHLTPTGLLMEGVIANYARGPLPGVGSECGDFHTMQALRRDLSGEDHLRKAMRGSS